MMIFQEDCGRRFFQFIVVISRSSRSTALSSAGPPPSPRPPSTRSPSGRRTPGLLTRLTGEIVSDTVCYNFSHDVLIHTIFNTNYIKPSHFSWSHTISDLRSPLQPQPCSPSPTSTKPAGQRKHFSQLQTALQNFKLSTWKSRQELARKYPDTLKKLGCGW